MTRVNKNYILEHYYLKDDGTFPNSHLPVLLYKGILDLPVIFPSEYIRRLFRRNNWTNSWKYGIYEYHHYHSTAHEVLGICKGKTSLQIGGNKGVRITVKKGDVLMIPAGVAHKNLEREDAVQCIGAYAEGHDYDINKGEPGERPQTDRNIRRVRKPSKDPVLGLKGPLPDFWK